jgi:hypothetical protein
MCKAMGDISLAPGTGLPGLFSKTMDHFLLESELNFLKWYNLRRRRL